MFPFYKRHIGPNQEQIKQMLEETNFNSLDELIEKNIPANIRRKKPLNLPEPATEIEILQELQKLSEQNPRGKYYIGLGFYPTFMPSVIRRNILENPGWYTAYTPYQAEISQGRLEMLIIFQTMITNLTKMDIANASMLDDGSAAAEAGSMMMRISQKKRRKANKFFVDKSLHPHIIDVIENRLKPFNVEIITGNIENFVPSEEYIGVFISYPTTDGEIIDYSDKIEEWKKYDILVAVYSDLMALSLLKPPGEWNVDIVWGSSQRFGVPMGYGGPNAAFFATKNEHVRQLPGRLIGVSKDKYGNIAYRMTLQTREQHIRREKATSNICTSQVLLAVISAAYALYYGPEGLKKIATNINQNTIKLRNLLVNNGFDIEIKNFFDTIKINIQENVNPENLRETLENKNIYLRYYENAVGISLNELTTEAEVIELAKIITEAIGKNFNNNNNGITSSISTNLLREDEPLQNPVFKKYHTETKLMRYLKKLENKDISLVHSMIPLGSCTMKLNSAIELYPIVYKGFSEPHPFIPIEKLPGYKKLIEKLADFLKEITGLSAVSFQPNSGAQGEYTGLRVIKAYLDDIGQGHRNIAFIPASAHGTNPASAVMAGLKVKTIKTQKNGYIDIEDLKKNLEKYGNELAVMMITYPSTYGIFEEEIKEICELVHKAGAQVYLDGANLNAMVGLSSIADIGGDVCHINLHKTFSIPHGGGGPGMGPIAVAEHLKDYLPTHRFVNENRPKAIKAIASAPYGSAMILPISYAYIRMMGSYGLTLASKVAVLNANYLKAKLEKYYKILYTNNNGLVAHEFILDLRRYKKSGIEAEDVAKRLIDYGYHAPTVSFPVVGTLMIEPTESEDKEELDKFASAMIKIHEELQAVENGMSENPLKNAPHSLIEAGFEKWEREYTRQQAFFPLPYLLEQKYWSPVARIDNRYGDRNIFCEYPSENLKTEKVLN